MALHGLIEVNGIPVGDWSAQRIKGDEGELCTYKCEVSAQHRTLKYPETVRFELQHHYDSGAVELAGSVLLEAAALLEQQRKMSYQ